jgi:general secretion pathway protein B
MSYLMDALRKAERERNIGRVPDAVNNEFATAYIPTHRRWHWLPLLLGGLIALNLVLLTAFWLSSRMSSTSAPPADPPPAPSQPAPSQPAPVPPAPADPVRPAPSAQASAPQQPAAPAAPDESPQSVSPPVASAGSAPAADPRYQAQSDTTPDEDIPAYTALSPSRKAGIPALTVNGHLYSSIPGRSFMLINGRRYGEGQRTAEGPAVVYIDEDGAVLDHQGLRFHLDAPR